MLAWREKEGSLGVLVGVRLGISLPCSPFSSTKLAAGIKATPLFSP